MSTPKDKPGMTPLKSTLGNLLIHWIFLQSMGERLPNRRAVTRKWLHCDGLIQHAWWLPHNSRDGTSSTHFPSLCTLIPPRPHSCATGAKLHMNAWEVWQDGQVRVHWPSSFYEECQQSAGPIMMDPCKVDMAELIDKDDGFFAQRSCSAARL